MSCRQAFLFSFVNPSGLEPIKLSLITGKEEYGIKCHSSCGPVFGGGCDLLIPDNANITSGCSLLGDTYQCPPGQQYTFFLGDDLETFMVTDYEVFGLRQ